MITLTTPLMLGGLALLSLPVIAHLMHRWARRTIVFPTIELLVQSAANQSRLFKLRRWILLLLRCLAVLLVVLAFSRPVWYASDSEAAAASQAKGVVLIFDTSLSTSQQTDGVEFIETLRGSAARTLDSMTSGRDVANVVVASDQPEAFFPRLSPNLPGIRAELARLKPVFTPADYSSAIALAGQQLAKHDGPRRLVILSDLQRSNWRAIAGQKNLHELLPKGTEVTVVDPGADRPDNVALSEPRTFPAQALAKQPIQLVVRVTNYAATPKQVRIDATVGVEPLSPQTLTLKGGEQRDVSFETQLDSIGHHEVVFRTTADGLAADNKAYLVVDTASRLSAVIVSDDDPDEPGSGTFFLSRALSPHEGNLDHYEVQRISPSELAAANLTQTSCVFVGYVGALPAAGANKLLSYIEQGGGVVFFTADGAADRHLSVLETAAGEQGISPWKLGPAKNLSLFDDALTITTGKWQARLLRQFDEQSQIAMSQIRFQRVWSAGAIHPETQILLSFSDGTPALASRARGAGQFVLANFSPSVGSSDLGKYGAFVALVQILAKELGQPASRRSAGLAGQTHRFAKTFPGELGSNPLEVVGPNDEPVAIFADKADDATAIQIQRADLPGIYRVRSGDRQLAAAGINVDPAESDLSRIGREELLACFGEGELASNVETVAGFSPTIGNEGRPLWGWMLLAGMCVFGVELLLVGLWRR